MNHELLDATEKSRQKAIDAKYHAHEMVLALECYYWTSDDFHYQEAISHFKNLVSEMARFQNEHRKEAENG